MLTQVFINFILCILNWFGVFDGGFLDNTGRTGLVVETNRKGKQNITNRKLKAVDNQFFFKRLSKQTAITTIPI